MSDDVDPLELRVDLERRAAYWAKVLPTPGPHSYAALSDDPETAAQQFRDEHLWAMTIDGDVLVIHDPAFSTREGR